MLLFVLKILTHDYIFVYHINDVLMGEIVGQSLIPTGRNRKNRGEIINNIARSFDTKI